MGPHLAAPRTEWTVDELRYYLSLITPEAMRYDGTESGLYGTADGVHIYAANATREMLSKRSAERRRDPRGRQVSTELRPPGMV